MLQELFLGPQRNSVSHPEKKDQISCLPTHVKKLAGNSYDFLCEANSLKLAYKSTPFNLIFLS